MPLDPTLHADDLQAWYGSMPVTSRYTYGPAGERFFRAMKDEARILGTRCGRCSLTYVPGRLFCERCFDELTDWIEVGPSGTIEAVTVAYLALDGTLLDPPVLMALVRLDGADTVMYHRLGGVAASDAKIGLRVEAAFRPSEDRTGSILDIAGFRPLGVNET
ncbi:MAG: Zn-ribbon domain-containing OB-fold protein [Armatimonadetes bacterium]|nr:Zn-ribbon domain-containing OB-fold protein [Armatimonadota bacterium]